MENSIRVVGIVIPAIIITLIGLVIFILVIIFLLGFFGVSI